MQLYLRPGSRLSPWGNFNELGPPDEELLGAKAPSSRLLVVREDDEPVGYVTWRRVWYGPNRESRAWNIGVSLIPSARGQGYGTEGPTATCGPPDLNRRVP